MTEERSQGDRGGDTDKESARQTRITPSATERINSTADMSETERRNRLVRWNRRLTEERASAVRVVHFTLVCPIESAKQVMTVHPVTI